MTMAASMKEFGMIISQFVGVFTSVKTLIVKGHPDYGMFVVATNVVLPFVLILAEEGKFDRETGCKYLKRVFLIEAFVCILNMWRMYSNHESIKDITLDIAETSNNKAQAMKKQSDRLKKSAGAQKYEGMIVTFINALVVAGVKGFSGMN